MHFKIVQGDEQLSSHSGIALVGEILNTSRLRERLDKVKLPDHPPPEISHGEVATAMIGLICAGKPDFDAIEPFRDDPFFTISLGLDPVPAQPKGSDWTAPRERSTVSFSRSLLRWSDALLRRLPPAPKIW